eukprot:TRINITY_DN16793_c0_g1_i1.p1 TRINITY_DN16793_c0_g1~~TRINITY_DN16793_c0_g1_i1.p1  ORF type:complete len:320 (-),score=62.84 TRINITY_DN16793_c0_g1_i1:41-1000(-)
MSVCVVGSSNVDLISYVTRLPVLGETICGHDFKVGFGGKGANQAVQAAKLGSDVVMVTRVGDDQFGKDYLKNYEKVGVNMQHVSVTCGAVTGVAPIAVDKDGNNSIIIVPGANNSLSNEDIDQAREAIGNSKVLVCQLEVLMTTTQYALQVGRELGVFTILNPAPAPPRNETQAPGDQLPAEMYASVDLLCPNETEAELLTGVHVESVEDAVVAARALLNRGPKSVLITLGAKGAVLVTSDGADGVVHTHIAPTPVASVTDTTGAGDSFIGALSHGIAKGIPLEEAARRAGVVAGISVQGVGTQTSFPTVGELPDGLYA